MGEPKGSKLIMGQITARGTSPLTTLSGPVMLAYGATEARITGVLRQAIGGFQGLPRIRLFATRPQVPGTWTPGTALSPDSDGSFSQDFSLASLGSNLFLQISMGGQVSSGAAGEAFTSFHVWTDSEARIVGRQRVELSNEVNATKTGYVVIGAPFPAFGLSGVMIAVIARGVTASQSVNFVTRTFKGDRTIPSSWGSDLLGSDKSFSAGNEDYNTGHLAWTPADVAYGQIGLKVAAADSSGCYDIIVAARYT